MCVRVRVCVRERGGGRCGYELYMALVWCSGLSVRSEALRRWEEREKAEKQARGGGEG